MRLQATGAAAQATGDLNQVMPVCQQACLAMMPNQTLTAGNDARQRRAPVARQRPEPLPEVLGEARKGAGQFAIIVDDVDAVSSELAGRGVRLLSGPADRPWGMRTVTFADPGGHIWEIAQEIPGDGS